MVALGRRYRATEAGADVNARPLACGGVNSVRVEHSRGHWSAHETETRTAIKDDKGRTVAYVQLGPNQDFDAALIATAPALLGLARRYAEECMECAGVGVQIDNSPCDDCRDIREVIAQATFVDE